jgi:hypothetical protein
MCVGNEEQETSIYQLSSLLSIGLLSWGYRILFFRCQCC